MINVDVSAKMYEHNNAYEEDYIQNLSTCICENIEYLVATINDSEIICYEIINGADSALTNATNITNTISANVTGTVPRNFGDKNARYKTDRYNLHTVFSDYHSD